MSSLPPTIKIEKKIATDIAIPKQINLIWIGGPIPIKYLYNMIKLVALAHKSGFTVNLWLDNKANYYNVIIREDFKIPFLKIKMLDELYAEMESDPFYSGENKQRLHDFMNFLNRERVGLDNLAAAADLLRYEILRRGGYYLDIDTTVKTDTELELEKVQARYTECHQLLIELLSDPELKSTIKIKADTTTPATIPTATTATIPAAISAGELILDLENIDESIKNLNSFRLMKTDPIPDSNNKQNEEAKKAILENILRILEVLQSREKNISKLKKLLLDITKDPSGKNYPHNSSNLKPDHIPYGVLVSGGMMYKASAHYFCMCNDMIACIPNHPLLEKLILRALERYKALDQEYEILPAVIRGQIQTSDKLSINQKKPLEENTSKKFDWKLNHFDNKRMHLSFYPPFHTAKDRRNLTIRTTGPGLIQDVFLEHAERLEKESTNGLKNVKMQLAFDRVERILPEPLLPLTLKVANLNAEMNSDKNWLKNTTLKNKTKKKVCSFDMESIHQLLLYDIHKRRQLEFLRKKESAKPILSKKFPPPK